MKTYRSPVRVCLGVLGLEVEPAKNGVHEGKGHHHIIIDVFLPKPSKNRAKSGRGNPQGLEYIKPLKKDKNHIHLGDGSSCTKVELPSGTHILRALFAKGNHVPYYPPITATKILKIR